MLWRLKIVGLKNKAKSIKNVKDKKSSTIT